MPYQPPGVTVEVEANTRIVSLSADVRTPAIIGVCPGTRTITDEPVQRGGSTDIDALANAAVSTITKAASAPGIPTGDPAIYPASEYQLSGGNGIDWTGGANTNEPSEGQTYYVSYTYALPASSYEPQLFTTSEDVIDAYGVEAVNNSLTLGCILALENGAPVVYGARASGSVANRIYFREVLTKLEKLSNIYVVVPMSLTTDIHADALAHVLQMSAIAVGKERQLFIGASGSIGDSDTAGTLVYMAGNPSNQRRTLVVGVDADPEGIIQRGTMLLDNSHIAAMVAGKVCGTTLYASTITGDGLVGASIPDEYWNSTEMNLLATAGITVIISRNSYVTVRHALTTDQTSADTAEISVVSGLDRVIKATRSFLESRFIGRGLLIDTALLGSIESGVASIWTRLVDDGEIEEYGTTNDPTTGQIPIKVTQNATEPRQVDVVGAVKLKYPMVWMKVQLVTYV